MGRKIKNLLKSIESASEKAGVGVSLLLILIMAITTTEVIARYVFNNPTIWAWPINRQLFGVFVLFAGVYTLLHGSHLRVEVIYRRFSPRLKFCTGLIGIVFFLVFMGVLVWQGGWMALNSIANGEYTQGAFKIPLYIFKAFIPVVAALFLLEGLANFFWGKERRNF